MVTIDSKSGLAIYRIGSNHNPGRFMHFILTSIDMLRHEGINNFIIDFSGFPTLSTRELMTLVKLASSLPGDSMMLTGIPDNIQGLLKASGLFKIFRIFDDVQSAMRSVIAANEESKLKKRIKSREELALKIKSASA